MFQVFCSRPLFHLSRSTPLAGRALHRRLKALLRHHATYLAPPASLSNLARRPVQPIPASLLSDELIDRIITEACFVAESAPDEQTGQERPRRGDDEDDDPDVETLENDDHEIENAFVTRLEARYASGTTARDWCIPVSPTPTDAKSMGPGTLIVPGWIRERAVEVLFGDQMDDEADSLPDAILRCILRVSTASPYNQIFLQVSLTGA